ncbi:MAG: lysostaphin resistance A-like protein [Gaiellaceae bacterium]
MTEITGETQGRGRLIAWLVFVGLLALISYLGRLSGTETPDDLAYRYSSSIAAIVQYAIMLGILLLIARGRSRRTLFALHRPRSWPRSLGLAVLALLAIYAAAVVYEQVLSVFGDWNPTEEQGLIPDGWDSSRAGAFVAFFLVVTFVAPVVEELTYRGLGLSLLVPYGTVLAILSAGFLFGAAHGLLIALPVLVIFGLIAGWLRIHTRSIYPPMLFHMMFNGIALIVSVSGVV